MRYKETFETRVVWSRRGCYAMDKFLFGWISGVYRFRRSPLLCWNETRNLNGKWILGFIDKRARSRHPRCATYVVRSKIYFANKAENTLFRSTRNKFLFFTFIFFALSRSWPWVTLNDRDIWIHVEKNYTIVNAQRYMVLFKKMKVTFKNCKRNHVRKDFFHRETVSSEPDNFRFKHFSASQKLHELSSWPPFGDSPCIWQMLMFEVWAHISY